METEGCDKPLETPITSVSEQQETSFLERERKINSMSFEKNKKANKQNPESNLGRKIKPGYKNLKILGFMP